MPTELEELAEFLHHGNSQVRQITSENLIPYSVSNVAIFKRHQLLPVRDLKLLVRDYQPISKKAITILINLSNDGEILKSLATDDAFLETLLKKITDLKDPNASDLATLLANLAKDPSLSRLLTLTRRAVSPSVSTSTLALTQLLDRFVKVPDPPPASSTSTSTSTPHPPDVDHLSYLFADLTHHAKIRTYFLTPQPPDNLIPLAKLTPFTTHPSPTRRLGVASTIKNLAFDVPQHPTLLSPAGLDILPALLLPLASGHDAYTDAESAHLPPDLQLLPPTHPREPDPDILVTHLETLTLLTTTRAGRDAMRGPPSPSARSADVDEGEAPVNVYPVLRECHLHVEDERVREACERLVDVLMRDEEALPTKGEDVNPAATAVGDADDDEDEKIVEVF